MWRYLVNAVRYGWRGRTLGQAFSEARERLGERMYAAGIDDGLIGAQIAALDQKIGQGSIQNSQEAIVAERGKLIQQLADSALTEEAPLPGAEDEYRAARDAQKAATGDGRIVNDPENGTPNS